MTPVVDAQKLASSLIRARGRLTQADVAKACGVDKGFISNLEQARFTLKRNSALLKAKKVVKHLRIRMPYVQAVNGAHAGGAGENQAESKTSILETHVGPIEEAPRFKPGELMPAPSETPDFTVNPPLNRMSPPSIADEPVSWIPGEQGLRPRSDIELPTRTAPAPAPKSDIIDLELSVAQNMGYQLELIQDILARDDILDGLRRRYVIRPLALKKKA